MKKRGIDVGKAKKAVKKSGKKKAKKPASKPTLKSPLKVSPKPVKIVWENLLVPLDDRMIVRPELTEKISAAGLILPETSAVSGQFRGTVLAVGRGHLDKKGKVRPMDVQAGDVVLFEEFAGSKANVKGVDVRILRESEILGIVEK
jgi:chaperonin GroES